MRIVVPKRVRDLIASNRAPYSVIKVREDDGARLYFYRGSRVLLRFSGTEPVLRIFSEAEVQPKAQELVARLQQCAQLAASTSRIDLGANPSTLIV